MAKTLKEAMFDSAHRVVAGFPGVGKSTLFKNARFAVTDSDSSAFPKDEFPANYIAHIQALITREGTPPTGVLVSSHKVVREALIEAGIPFILAYPRLDCKEEYIQRYRERGSPEAFLTLLEANFDAWVTECMAQEGCVHLVLLPGQFLANQLDFEPLTGEFLPN